MVFLRPVYFCVFVCGKMTYVYPDDGHIYVCVRVRDAATLPHGVVVCSPGRQSAREAVNIAQRICVSTIENIVVMHDPKHIDNASFVARDADGVVQFLTARSSSSLLSKQGRLGKTILTPTASASCFECDMCLNSMDTNSMMRMPLICNSDFISPPERCTQEDVYLSTAAHAVKAAVEGINSCVFAYGQTGSGKTYTLFGDTTCLHRDSGVVTRTLDDLFQRLEALKNENQSDTQIEYSYRVQFSFFEIYHNEVYCLLSRKGPLRVSFMRDRNCKEETMVIHDLRQHFVGSAEKSYPLVQLGLRRRQTGETGMNARSSRSHAILQICVRQWRTNRITKESVELSARITLVDLAGSERQKTAKTDGKSRDEGIQINQSLATLARVINEISRGASYVSYRDSLLTMVLKDNLGGNSKTFMIATISPMAFCYQESCATLQYAKNVRKIRNCPIVNKKFQTRSNLLQLNALLKKENEQLRNHVNELLKNSTTTTTTNTIDDVGAHITDDLYGLRKVTGVAKACSATLTRESGGTGAAVVTEAVITAPGVAAAPLVLTTCRRYTSVDAIGTSCVPGDSINVTSLSIGIVRFSIADLLPGARESTAGAELQLNTKKEYGVIEFERVSEGSFEHHYWVRYIPPNGTKTTTLNDTVDCQFNGHIFNSGDQRQLAHGDVVCIFLDSVNDTSEQMLLSFHYVDTNCLSRRSGGVAGIMDNGGRKDSLTAAVEGDGVRSESVVERLLREEARLKGMLEAKERVIEYQCQREAESRSRVTSIANCHNKGNNNSRSPSPLLPQGYAARSAFVTTPLQANAAAHASRQNTVSQSVKSGSSKDLQEFVDSSYRPCTTARIFGERSSTMEELMRRLAELEKSLSQDPNIPIHSLKESSVHNSVSSASMNTTLTEVDETELELSVETEESVRHGLDDTASQPKPNVDIANVAGGEEKWDVPTADELLLRHQADPELKQFGNMHLYMATSDGVCERYKAALRERVLCERILSLERSIGNLQSKLQLIESKLRIANDVIMEHEVSEAQLRDEIEEMSKALADGREKNTVLLRDINSLETFLVSTEKALAEATSINEQEFEKRFAHMSREMNALKDVAKMWRRRAIMKHAYFKTSNEKENKSADDVDDDYDDYDIGDNAAAVNMDHGGQWNDSNTESSSPLTGNKFGKKGEFAHPVFTSAVVNRNDKFELERQTKKAPTKLGDKDLNTSFYPNSHNVTLRNQKALVDSLRSEKQELEIENDGKVANSGISKKEKEEIQRLKKLYKEKCKECTLAEKKFEDVMKKLQADNKKKATTRHSTRKNSQLIEEQQRVIERHRQECQRLCDLLKSKDKELSMALHVMRGCLFETGVDGFKSDKDIRDRIETLLEDATKNCTGNCGFSAFPSDIVFNEELVALIRISLRIMMDRLKIELYVLNRQSLHKIGLLVPAVQLRPDAQFHFFMYELRGVVAELAGKPQRIGAKWSIEEGDVLSELVDHRRRRIGNALNGLLIWYDHWDLAPKTEHISYVELIRNSERIMQLARLVRQESLVNTNATSSLRHILTLKGTAADVLDTPNSSKDTTVVESRRILEKLNAETNSSNLARVVGSGKITPKSAVFQRSQTTISSLFFPRKSEIETSRVSRANAGLASTRVTTGRFQFSAEKKKPKERGDESKFVRRATALVMPVTDNEVTAVASTALARHGSTFNFDRQLTAVNTMDAEAPKQTVRTTTRLARSKTDVSHLRAALGGESVTRKSGCASVAVGGGDTGGATRLKATPAKTATRASRTSLWAFAPLQQRKRASGGDHLNFSSPSIPSAASSRQFYDSSILERSEMLSGSEKNRQTTKKLKKPAKKQSTALSMRSVSISTAQLAPVEDVSRDPFASSSFEAQLTKDNTGAVLTASSSFATQDPLPLQRVQEKPIVPKLCFDSLAK